MRVELRTGVEVDLARLERHFYTTSSCGVCGKTSLEAVRVQCRSRPDEGVPLVDAEVIHELPAALRQAQLAFQPQPGVARGSPFRSARQAALPACEDVGRHNAVDKVIGRTASLRPARPCPSHPVRQREGELRAGSEGGGCRHPHPGGRGRAVEPRRRAGTRAWAHRAWLRQPGSLQYLRRAKPNPRSSRRAAFGFAAHQANGLIHGSVVGCVGFSGRQPVSTIQPANGPKTRRTLQLQTPDSPR